MKHTPARWSVSPFKYAGMIGIDGYHGATVAAAYGPEDAAHIVRCVNAHDDLVGALRAVEPNVESILAGHRANAEHLITLVRAALAKANQ